MARNNLHSKRLAHVANGLPLKCRLPGEVVAESLAGVFRPYPRKQHNQIEIRFLSPSVMSNALEDIEQHLQLSSFKVFTKELAQTVAYFSFLGQIRCSFLHWVYF